MILVLWEEKVKINPEIFRQYDIRGIVDEDLTQETVELLGKGIGSYFRKNKSRKVALGRDCRLSSPLFAEALAKGLLSSGCQIVDLGIIPTPLLYFTMYQKKMEAGVIITGSHNPPNYNGFKMMVGEERQGWRKDLDLVPRPGTWKNHLQTKIRTRTRARAKDFQM